MKAGKTMKKPKNEAELIQSRIIALVLAIFTLLFYGFLVGFASNLPTRIYLRAALYLVPLLTFVIKFYQGISVSWMVKGLMKYWLFTIFLIYIWIVVVQMVFSIFYAPALDSIGYSGGLLLIFIGGLYMIYYRQKALNLKKRPDGTMMKFKEMTTDKKVSFSGWMFAALLFFPFFIGGLIMWAWATGLGDWFFQSVLGW